MADLRLAELASRMQERGIAFEIDEDARDFIAQEGYDRRFGARPLRRAIQSLLENPLAKSVLSGALAEGDRVKIGRAGDALTFSAEKAGPDGGR